MNELRFIVLTIILTLLSQVAWPQNSKTFSFVHGLEWGGTFNYYHYSYCLYLTQEQFLAERESKGTMHHVNGFVNYSAGVSLRRMEALLYAGFQGFDKGIRTIPVGLRTLVHRREDLTGLFGFIDGNVGIPIRNIDRLTTYCAVGIGWRTKIGDGIYLDHSFGISDAIVSPTEIYDPYSDCPVAPQDIRESRSNKLGFRLSSSIRF